MERARHRFANGLLKAALVLGSTFLLDASTPAVHDESQPCRTAKAQAREHMQQPSWSTQDSNYLTIADSALAHPKPENIYIAGNHLARLANDISLQKRQLTPEQKQDYIRRWNTLSSIVDDHLQNDSTSTYLILQQGVYDGLYNPRGIVPVLDILPPQEYGLDTAFVNTYDVARNRLNTMAGDVYTTALEQGSLPPVKYVTGTDTLRTGLGENLHEYANLVKELREVAQQHYPVYVDSLTGLWNATGNFYNYCQNNDVNGYLQYFSPDTTQK